MKNNKNETKKLKQIAIEAELHKEVKIQAAKDRKTIKEFVENIIKEVLGIIN